MGAQPTCDVGAQLRSRENEHCEALVINHIFSVQIQELAVEIRWYQQAEWRFWPVVAIFRPSGEGERLDPSTGSSIMRALKTS